MLSRENYTNRQMCIPTHKQFDKNTCNLLYTSPIIFNILTYHIQLNININSIFRENKNKS